MKVPSTLEGLSVSKICESVRRITQLTSVRPCIALIPINISPQDVSMLLGEKFVTKIVPLHAQYRLTHLYLKKPKLPDSTGAISLTKAIYQIR